MKIIINIVIDNVLYTDRWINFAHLVHANVIKWRSKAIMERKDGNNFIKFNIKIDKDK